MDARDKTNEMTEEQLAEARGDVFVPEDSNEIVLKGDMDPGILAAIAGDEGEPVDDESGEKGAAKKDDEQGKKDDFIPKARFNELNNENKQLKARLEALEKGGGDQIVVEEKKETPPDLRTQLKELRTLQKDALLEGDHNEHSRLTDEIDSMQIAIAKAEIQAEQRQEKTQAELVQDLDKAASAAMALYPFLDNKSDACDPVAVVAVRSWRAQLEAQGLAPAEALRQAVEDLGPKFAQINGVVIDPDKAEDVRKARNLEALKRNSDASLRQPSVLPGKTEKDSFVINVNDLSPAQMKALSEDQKAKLRGDVL